MSFGARKSRKTKVRGTKSSITYKPYWHMLRGFTMPGRSSSPSPAVGHMAEHMAEQESLVADALLNPFNNHVAE